MSWKSMSQRSTKSHKLVKSIKSTRRFGNTDWFSSKNIPLLYLDCKEIRTFVPADLKRSGLTEAEKGGKHGQDLFLFQISKISVVPHADNPLQRLVVKEDIYRKAVHAGISQQPGSEVEDRQYQLDVNGISLNVASWEQVMRASEQSKMKVGSEVMGLKTQNPALEWNLSLPKQDPEHVKLTPVAQEFDLHMVVAPAIVMDKWKADKIQQGVVICGHSLELNATTDMTFYIGTEQVYLAQKVMETNILCLLEGKSGGSHVHILHPSDPTILRPPSLEDSGLGSEYCSSTPKSEVSGVTRQIVFSPPLSVKPQRALSLEPAVGPQKRSSKMKGVTPFDALMTGRKITLYLYSKDAQQEKSAPGKRSTSPGKSRKGLHPFLQIMLSQPSMFVAMEKRTQKMEMSFYDFTIDGASINKDVAGHSLPQTTDYTVPWLETCPGEPDPKTGVRHALFTFTVNDFMMSNAAKLKILIGRPMKVNFSLSKIEQVREFLKRLQPAGPQQVTKDPLEVEEIRLMTTPKPGQKAVPISLPGRHSTPKETSHLASQNSQTETTAETVMMLSHIQSITMATTQIVLVAATIPDPDYPHIVASTDGIVVDSMFVVNQKTDELLQVVTGLHLRDVQLKTSLKHRTRPLLGPVTLDLSSHTNHGPHSSSKSNPLLPRVFADVDIKHIPVSFGQEHLNCLTAVADRLTNFLGELSGGTERESAIKKTRSSAAPSTRNTHKSDLESDDEEDEDAGVDDENVIQIEHKDDLRKGAFQYFTEGHTEDEIPLPNEMYFTPPSQTSGHWGTMVWTYPEPRMDVGLYVTPIPICNPDIKSYARITRIPCILQSYNESRQCFSIARQFFVSETERFHEKHTIEETRDLIEEMDGHSTWRVLLNTTMERSAMQLPLNPPGPDIILTPMTLAASMRFDTVFAPRFISSACVSINVNLVEIRLANHLGQLGQAQPSFTEPFSSDGSSPSEQEFMVIRVTDTNLGVDIYGGLHARTRIRGEFSLQSDLLNYGNLTMSPLLRPVEFEICYSIRNLIDIEGTICCGLMTFQAGQGTVHTLTKAVQAWTQNKKPKEERLLFGYYLICNDTDEMLRFGQVHTDESVVLASREMHEYSWRSHKKQTQELHVCIEGWRNFRWSEPFSIDGMEETVVRVLHNKEQTATLFIRTKKISSLQKQVILSGPQVFVSRLSIPLDVQFVCASRDAGSKSADPERHKTSTLRPKSSLPSLTCSDDDITGVRVKVQGSSCDWSEQFAIGGEMSSEETVIKVPCADGKKFYFWCQIFTDAPGEHTARLILFSPLFAIQSHLPYPVTIHSQAARGNDSQIMVVKSHGSIHHLYQIPPMAWYNMTFHSRTEATSSGSAVCLSTEMLEDVAKHPSEGVGLQELMAMDDGDDAAVAWPYNHPDYKSSNLHATTLHEIILMADDKTVGTPKTTIQVGLSQHRSKVNTILMEVTPRCLVVNETGMDATIQEEGGQLVKVKGGTTVAPQKFKGVLSVSMTSSGGVEYRFSNQIRLLTDADTPSKRRNAATQALQLMPDDYKNIELVRMGGKAGMKWVVHLTVHSSVKHNIRLLTLRPRFVIMNNSKHDLCLRVTNVASKEKVSLQGLSLQTITLASKSNQDSSSANTSLLEWEGPACGQPMESVQYLSVALNDNSSYEKGVWFDKWSAWVNIDGGFPRLPFTVPVANPTKSFLKKDIATTPMVAMVHQHEGVTYIALDNDPSPKMLIINGCPFPIHIGQSSENAKPENPLEIEEEMGPLPAVPAIPPGSVIHYNPSVTSQTKQTNIYKFHFAVAKPPGTVSIPSQQSSLENPEIVSRQWSEAIDILDSCLPTRSEIVAMPTGGYLLIATECVGSLIHIFVDSLNAKDDGKEDEIYPDTHLISMSIGTRGIVVMVMDELMQGSEVQEVLRITADQVNFVVVPREDLKRSAALNGIHLLQFAVGGLQIDNQSYASGRYDFPVLFRGHERWEDDALEEINAEYMLTPEPWYNFIYAECVESRETSFLSMHVFVESNEGFGDRLRNAEIALHKMEMYIEDQFMNDALTMLKTFNPGSSIPRRQEIRTGLPSVVKLAICALKSPIEMQQLTILPIVLTASVHASLKMFVSLDQTVLKFDQFETGPIFATHRQLGQALTLHYTSGAFLKAGWAIGSLDIIGNPVGFLRSVRTGLIDTVYLPYEGLTRGPSAFVSGMTSGLSSLVRHLSAGTLTSLTKFAYSVSRNLDRLSLDADHAARLAEQRRRVPEHLSAGILQGLNSFGISVLGAIAGIADQPLRSFHQLADPTTPTSPSQKARGVISGVGKGLVGAVIKPLGGAAELVAQTGQGLLHGTGLAERITPKDVPHHELKAAAANSRLKYSWKMLRTLPNSDILMHVEVTSTTFHGLQRGGILLLTPEVLFVVGISEDTQQLTLPLCDIECRPIMKDGGVKVVVKRPASPSFQESPPTADRVADFVAATSDKSGQADDEPVVVSSDGQSETSVQSPSEVDRSYQYIMNPSERETFLSVFGQAKSRLAGKGFCYDEMDNVEFSRFKTWHLSTKSKSEEDSKVMITENE